MTSIWTRIARGVDRLETGVLALFVLALVILAAAQILARWLAQSPEWLDLPVIGWLLGWTRWLGPWVDPTLRVMVLWVGMLGALAAAKEDRHIQLELLQRRLKGRAFLVVRGMALGFAAIVSGLLARASWGLVDLERESGSMLLDGVPLWWSQLILPVGFGLLALRFAIRAVRHPARTSSQ